MTEDRRQMMDAIIHKLPNKNTTYYWITIPLIKINQQWKQN